MPIPILMPALSPTMTEGNLASWLKKPGEKVSPGDIIAEIETDKATMEVESIDEGTLGRILIEAGTEGVAVNTPIAVLLEEGEDESALEGFDAGGDGAAEAAPAKSEGPPAKSDGPRPATEPPATPAKGYGRPAGGETAQAPAGRPNGQGERVFASPLARRIAAQEGLDIGRLDGSGPHGRIVKRDVEAALEKGVGKAAPAAAPTEAAPPAAPAPAPSGVMPQPLPTDRPFVEIKLNTMRKTIAKRLVEAKSTIPHFYLNVDVRLDDLLELRRQLNDRPGAKAKLSVNDFVIKACALALRDVPDSNACWGGDKILRYEVVDVAVAVALEGGLITPIIRDADRKPLSLISTEMKELAERARAGKLKPEEYQGGSFSLSNLGMFGIKDFAAVINPPHGSILAVGAGEQRPVVEGGAVQIATVMGCCLSVDHRVIDGALGATWLKAFKGYVEDPMGMLV